MSGNPTLNRLIRQTIYDLKHRFGGEVTVYKVVDSTTNYKTGSKTIDTTSRSVRRAIVLPSTLSREIFQSVSYLSASKSFASLGGQGWDETSRGFIFDGSDLRDYTWELEDWIVYRGKRYDLQSIESLEWDTGFMIVAKEVKGQISGGGPRIIIESGSSDFTLTGTATGARDIPAPAISSFDPLDMASQNMDFSVIESDDLALTSGGNASATGQFFDGGEDEVTFTSQGSATMDFLRAVSDAMALVDDAEVEQEFSFMFGWSGYALSTPDNPASSLTDFTYYIDLAELPQDWWDEVKSDGGDIRATKDDDATQLPVDLIYFDYGGQTGLIAVKYSGTKATSNEPIRVYAGNAGATLPADGDTYGRENAYASHAIGVWPDGAGTDRTGNDNDVTMTGSMSVGAAAGPWGSTKASDYDGSTNYGEASAVPITTEPATLMGWVNSDITTGNQYVLHANDGSGTNANGLELRLNGTTDIVEIRQAAGGGVATAATATTWTTSTWYSVFGSFASTTSRTVGLDGGNFATDTNTRDPNGMNLITLGAFANTGHGAKFNGRLSLLEAHNIALSQNWYTYWHAMGNQATFYNGWTWNNV